MEKKILKSIFTLSAAVVVAVGATFAALTSNTVTIANSQASSGTPHLRLCERNGTWLETITPNFSAEGLTPGDEGGVELTTTDVFLGNAGPQLAVDNAVGTGCGYNDEPIGNSDQNMTILPKLDNVNCLDGGTVNPDNIELKLLVSGVDSDWHPLSFWQTNTAAVASLVVGVDDAVPVEAFVRATDAVTDPDKTCTFNIIFNGDSTPDAETTSPLTI